MTTDIQPVPCAEQPGAEASGGGVRLWGLCALVGGLLLAGGGLALAAAPWFQVGKAFPASLGAIGLVVAYGGVWTVVLGDRMGDVLLGLFDDKPNAAAVAFVVSFFLSIAGAICLLVFAAGS